MKIVVALRTRNEEANIEHFCRSYDWADRILIADGDSTDRTKELASKFPNVSVRDYEVYIEMSNGYIRNPHGSHLNFLIDWAFLEEDADWIIQDDCDCFPNKYVRGNSRVLLEHTDMNYVYVTRLYLWKNEGHFPDLAKPNKSKDYVQSLWAWRKGMRLRFRSDKVSREASHQELIFKPPEEERLYLVPPYALLHRFCPDDETVERKLKFYRESGQIPNMLHPLEFGGKIEPLPEWATEE